MNGPGPGEQVGTDRPALQALLSEVAEHAGDRDPTLLAGLASAAFRRLPDGGLEALDARVVAARLGHLLDFITVREPGLLALGVREPFDGEGPGTVIECSVEDTPFLLSTITEELAHGGFTVRESIHPVIGVERDDAGRLRALQPARAAPRRESCIRLQLREATTEDRRAELHASLTGVLEDARAATGDYRAMLEAVDEVAFRTRSNAGAHYGLEQVEEASALLRWLIEDHFVLLGYREYDIIDTGGPAVVVTPDTGLGILRDERSSTYADPVPLDRLSPGLRERVEGGDLLIVSRTNRASTVHRRSKLIYVGVKKLSDDGRVAGECRLLGLFSEKAYAEPASTIPVLRRKLQHILEAEDIVEGSHDERSVRVLFEALPKHELFQAPQEGLRRSIAQLLEAQQRQDVLVLVRVDETRHSVSSLVSIPRDRFNAVVRQRVQQLLADRFGAEHVDYHLSLTERDQALLHFLLYLPPADLPDVNLAALEDAVAEITRSWQDELTRVLIEQHGSEEGERVAATYRRAFPPGYTDTVAPPDALADIAQLEALVNEDPERAVRMALGEGDALQELRFKLYKIGEGVELSAFLPILESLGFVVMEELPHRLVDMDVVGEVHLHDFGIRCRDPDLHVNTERDGPRLAEAALAMWAERAEADSLNRLVLKAGLTWREVGILRAYRRYRRQVGTSFTEAYLNDALLDHPGVARALVGYFDARFNPARADEAGASERARADVLDACEAVERLDQDRILRGWLGLIDATLRTNYYVDHPHSVLALKLDSHAVPDMPKPVPEVEVFVYSPFVEAVHLRGGAVARGGLRWSDRREDFRTEILGLMKAQMVKNAVIVPTGSKGGFVLKRPPDDPHALREEVRRRYLDFIRGLLDLTDNVVDGQVVAPPGVRRADGDDPYLVVAADRGTATFSDVANEISLQYGYWLGDAFASGGSRGYDHKAMGITARGAWVAVQRHFRELDVDVQTDPVTVVGIGDMSGDVFGNGLLRSRTVKLVAAFDHRDVFLDPDPDPEASFSERKRLFELAGSSWRDYDPDLISPGGGVWSRTAKLIPLSEDARRVLRVDAEALSPPELIQAILRAPVDLLFAGGIGTFVKASGESHGDVGDRVNDAIRINSNELGARVVGEGGNLALTQRARVQYARRGGRCNTDAIDNSAGVDTSDREVNLKILLDLARVQDEIDAEVRDALLVEVTEDVGHQVLRAVYLQTGAISQEVAHSPGGLEAYEALMADLEAGGRLDRAVEALPDTAEMERRRNAGAGMSRPELAVLLGYAKEHLTNEVGRSDLPDQDAMRAVLRSYFPGAVAERFEHLLPHHPLRRELVATFLANDLCNRMGVTYANRTAGELGRPVADVAACYWIARQVTDADLHWRAIGILDGQIEPSLQLELKSHIDRLVDAGTRRYLRGPDAHDVGTAIARDAPPFHELEKEVGGLGSSDRQARRQAKVRRFTDLGIDGELAERVVGAAELAFLPEVAAVARACEQDARHVAEVFLRVGDVLPLPILQQRLDGLSPVGMWERWQHRQLADELRDIRRLAAKTAVERYPDAPPDEAVDRYLSDCRDDRARAEVLIAKLATEGDVGLPGVAVAVRALREAITP